LHAPSSLGDNEAERREVDKIEEKDEGVALGVFLITLTCCSSDTASVVNREQEHIALTGSLLLGEQSAKTAVVALTDSGFVKPDETADVVKACGGEEELESEAAEPLRRWSVKSRRPGAKVVGTEEEEEEEEEQEWRDKGDRVEALGNPEERGKALMGA